MKSRNIGLIISYIYFICNTILGILISSFIVRKIGKTVYGVYQTVSSFAAYLVLLEFGTGTVMARNIALSSKENTDEINKNVSTVWLLTIILSGIIILFSFIFYLLIDIIYANSLSVEQRLLGKRILIYVSINLLFSFLTQTLNGVTLGYEVYSLDKIIALIRLVMRTALIICLLLYSSNVLFIVQIDAALALLNFIILYFFCRKKLRVNFSLKNFDKSIFFAIIPFCFAMLMETFVNTANGNVDKFLIGILLTPEDVTLYSISMVLFSMFSTVATLPVSLFKPEIAKNVKNGIKGKELTAILEKPCRQNVLITGLITFGLLIVGRQFIEIVYGVEYSDSWIYAMIIIVPLFLNMANAVIINVLDVMNKRMVRSIVLIVTTLLNIIATLIALNTIGMIGAAIATGLSLIVQTIIMDYYYFRHIGINVIYLYKKSFKGILLCLIGSAIVSYIPQLIIKSYIAQFFVSGMIFVIVFGLLFYFKGANISEKSNIQKILKKLKKNNHK